MISKQYSGVVRLYFESFGGLDLSECSDHCYLWAPGHQVTNGQLLARGTVLPVSYCHRESSAHSFYGISINQQSKLSLSYLSISQTKAYRKVHPEKLDQITDYESMNKPKFINIDLYRPYSTQYNRSEIPN